jgi:hypothetical protein
MADSDSMSAKQLQKQSRQQIPCNILRYGYIPRSKSGSTTAARVVSRLSISSIIAEVSKIDHAG